MSPDSKSGEDGMDRSVLGRVTDSLKARFTGLNGVESSHVNAGKISNRVPGSLGVLKQARDVQIEADEISGNSIAEEAEEVAIDSDRVIVSGSVLEEAENSFASFDELESGTDQTGVTKPTIGRYSEGSAATVREQGNVSLSGSMVAFTGETDSNTTASYNGNWEELDQELKQKALSGELKTENFSLGNVINGTYSSVEAVDTSLNILKTLDDRMDEESFRLDEEVAEASENNIQRVRQELGKVLSRKVGLGQEKAAEIFGQGGNVFLQRFNEIESISENEEGLDIEVGDNAFHGLRNFSISANSIESPENYRPSVFNSSENGEISVDSIKSHAVLRDASEIDLKASDIRVDSFGEDLTDSKVESSRIEGERVLRDAEDVKLTADKVEADSLGYRGEGLEMEIGEVSGDTKLMWGAENSVLEADSVEAVSLVAAGTGNEISVGEARVSGDLLSGNDNFMEAEYIEAGDVMDHSDGSEIVSEYFEAEEVLNSARGSKLKVEEAVISEGLFDEFSDNSYLMAESLQLPSTEAVKSDADYSFNILAARDLTDAEGDRIEVQDLIGKSLGVVTEESSSSAITYRGEWDELETFLDSFLLEEGEEDLDFIYDQMTDGEYTSSEKLLEDYEFVSEVGEIDIRRGQKEDLLEKAEGSVEILREVKEEDYSEEIFSRVNEIEKYASENWEAFYTERSDEKLLEDIELLDAVDRFSFRDDERKREAFTEKKDVLKQLKEDENSSEVFYNVRSIEHYTGEDWDEFYLSRDKEEMLDEVEIIETVDSFRFDDERRQKIFEEKSETVREIKEEDYGEKFFNNIADIEELTGKEWDEFYRENRNNGIEEEIEIIERLSEAEKRGNETDTEDVSQIREENEELLRELQGREWGDYLMRNVDRFNENDDATLPGMIDKFRDGSPDNYLLNPGFQEEYFVDPSGEIIEEPGEAQQKYMEESLAHLERIQRGAGNFMTPLKQEEIEEIVREVDEKGLIDTDEIVPEEAEEYGDAFIQNVNSELGPRIGELMQEDREKGQQLVELKNQMMDKVGEKRRQKAFEEVGLDKDTSDLSVREIGQIFEGLYEEHMDDSDVRQKTRELAETEGAESVDVELYDNNIEDLLIKDRSVPCTFPGSDYDNYEGNFIDYMLDPGTQILEVEDSRGEAYVVTNLVEFEGDDYLMVHSVESDDGITSRGDTSKAIKQGIEEYVSETAWEPYHLDLEESNGEIEGLIYSMDNHNSAAQDFQEKALENDETYDEEEIEVRKKGRTDMRFDVNYDPEAEINGFVKHKTDLPKTWKGLEPGVSEGIEQVLG